MLNPSRTPCLLPMDTKAVMLTGAVSQSFQGCFFFIGNGHSPLPSTSIINLSLYPTSLDNCSMPHPWSREWRLKENRVPWLSGCSEQSCIRCSRGSVRGRPARPESLDAVSPPRAGEKMGYIHRHLKPWVGKGIEYPEVFPQTAFVLT